MKEKLERAAYYLTCGSLVSILFSIAVSQILLALAFAAFLMSGAPLKFPPLKLPLALFIAGTFLALVLSVDPRGGLPQIRKMFLFLILLLVYSLFKSLAQIRTVILLWAAVAAISATRSLFQFIQKYQQARDLHQDFYSFYIGERITGFMSHWMTFGGEEMIVVLMLAAYLFFGAPNRWKKAGVLCGAILLISLVLGYTRSIFLLGLPIGLVYLLWSWRRWLVLAVPVAAAVGVLAIPSLRERVASISQPHGERDSNLHRVITRRTGLAMIEAHPVFGLGPEQPKYQFDKWVPADISRPLPEGWYGHLHNIYLQYAAERGIPTLLALLWFIGKAFFDFARGIWRGSGERRFVLHGAIAVILAILAEGFFEYNLGDSEVLTLFLTVIAFGYVALQSAEGRELEPQRT